MSPSARFLNPSEAARRLGVSIKALRLYEAHGLVRPSRSAAGWRTYGADEMTRAARIVALRGLGLGFSQIANILGGDAQDLEPTLAAHQAALEDQLRDLRVMVEGVRGLRAGISEPSVPVVAFDLPWPWGGERFELRILPPISFITGPLGCGKTRLALHLAEAIPGAVFLPMDRAIEGAAAAHAALNADPCLKARVDLALTELVGAGATAADDLVVLLAGLEAEGPATIVIDMVEQGLDQPTQTALMAYLRRRAPGAKPLFLMARSNAILDLGLVGPDEAIIFCPANHSPPMLVSPRVGAPGYEALSSCLASPQVRARTEGMWAFRPRAA